MLAIECLRLAIWESSPILRANPTRCGRFLAKPVERGRVSLRLSVVSKGCQSAVVTSVMPVSRNWSLISCSDFRTPQSRRESI